MVGLSPHGVQVLFQRTRERVPGEIDQVWFCFVLFFKGRAGVFSLSQAQKRGAAGKEGPAYEAATSQVYRSQTPCLPAHRDQDLAQSRLFLYSFPMQPRER